MKADRLVNARFPNGTPDFKLEIPRLDAIGLAGVLQASVDAHGVPISVQVGKYRVDLITYSASEIPYWQTLYMNIWDTQKSNNSGGEDNVDSSAGD